MNTALASPSKVASLMEIAAGVHPSFDRVAPGMAAVLSAPHLATLTSKTCVKSSSEKSTSVSDSASSLPNFACSYCSSSKTLPVRTRQ